ncbi:uncharacterized protein LOC142609279 [Castanea sativa]|uniref:uncharacterized protein LOC142609279 n=1 Tax=Castanea sativa TaxID=21020 RepID=UPI003F649CA9
MGTRPTSCCNLIYKCTTKILANTLRPCLANMIRNNQTTFIPNRCTAENIILAQELVKNYHRPVGIPRCLTKVNLMKAYEYMIPSIWTLRCLAAIGVPEKFVA